MISGVMDEVLCLAEASGCIFAANFKQQTRQKMASPNLPESSKWQDYVAGRPLKVEAYLGSLLRLAQIHRIPLPRIQTLYAILHHVDIVNRRATTGVERALAPSYARAGSLALTSPPGPPHRQSQPRDPSIGSETGSRQSQLQPNTSPHQRRPPLLNYRGGSSLPSSRRVAVRRSSRRFPSLAYGSIPEVQEPVSPLNGHADLQPRPSAQS